VFDRHQGGENAVLVHIDFTSTEQQDCQEQLAEFVELVTSASLNIEQIITAKRATPHAKYYVGTGKMDEIAETVKLYNADVVLFNHALSPAQERNVEKHCECRVVDRTGLILDIFAQRASTYEGKLQVELAQLKHISTRLIRGWTHLERQKGGIGLRGPGETQLETDRRLLRGRISSIEKRLAKVAQQRDQGRRSRQRAEVPTVSLVGYTNAGKSTLFNYITNAKVLAEDRLFATLDPTLRRVELVPGQAAIVADTVGFIRHLPHDLVAAFRATLEETREADLLLHIIDAADPHMDEKVESVEQVLADIGAEQVPVLKVFNKVDQCPNLTIGVTRDQDDQVDEVRISAKNGEGIELFKSAIAERVAKKRVQCQLKLPADQGRIRGLLFHSEAIRNEHALDDGSMVVDIELAESDWQRLQQKLQLDLDQFIHCDS
jgi:GTPase